MIGLIMRGWMVVGGWFACKDFDGKPKRSKKNKGADRNKKMSNESLSSLTTFFLFSQVFGMFSHIPSESKDVIVLQRNRLHFFCSR